MAVPPSDTLPLTTEHDVVAARQVVRHVCQELGFSLVEQTKMVTAASELARNTVTHGGGGSMRYETLTNGARRGVRLTFQDQGPGIADLQLALTDGWTTGNGLGMGLSGARRLVNDFEIESKPDRGTRVTIARWK